MTKQEATGWLVSRGYDLTPLSRKGGTKNLYYVHPEKPGRRYAVSSVMLRLEGKMDDGTWFRIRSGYFKDLSVNDKNQVSGMK